MEIEVSTLHAFSDKPLGGNPAGVVLQAGHLSDSEMQEIARQVGFSETAFVMPSDQADFKVRYFTPSDEVDLCGHATIALFYLMKAQHIVDVGVYTLETLAGILEVVVHNNGEVYLSQALPEFGEIVDRQDIADSLGISTHDLHAELPVQIVSTGLRDILIAVNHVDVLSKIIPDFKLIAEISKANHVVGYHVFALKPDKESTLAECRNFAPLYDIPEESATGTSNGALLCYLHKNNQISDPHDTTYTIRQGYTMNRPSEIRARLTLGISNEITKIQVGGVAVHIKNIRIQLS
ncbi:PhzF family phenazine biosynthesis protein [Paenibacillus taichungensis]|uniref:PhzF family phenazine biosynthesis protein n=1 Tax=Paenibacillus taichungensis TaxID=484184 RepID=UPI002DB9DCB0|nr:PhzF family phenazine biosynthesis protein [Paenibacillus taichungensis]MEC0108618.1 PhzF family phenazine biosynthesis protein [Paenibacillus taichungensis]MEC0196118.1 PhzF family phenazine biosynthesis protein [Paenibacillus taichungensis]